LSLGGLAVSPSRARGASAASQSTVPKPPSSPPCFLGRECTAALESASSMITDGASAQLDRLGRKREFTAASHVAESFVADRVGRRRAGGGGVLDGRGDGRTGCGFQWKRRRTRRWRRERRRR